MLVVDEASMLDLWLFHNLLKALQPTAHLLLVGDVDQLPSVGAGNVLRDVIDSGIASVTRLNQIFRQDDSSHIVSNAHRINQGRQPVSDNRSNDFYFFNVEDPEAVAGKHRRDRQKQIAGSARASIRSRTSRSSRPCTAAPPASTT